MTRTYELVTMSEEKHSNRLGEMFATAICGNDILSSTLYVSGIAILYAGIYAPVILAAIVVVLLAYKLIYTEVVEALPVNGGAYNCLLNGTSKTFAAVAGNMTFLSYVATAVISAKVSLEYLHVILPIPVLPATIALLLFFALLVISGIKDSAKVALSIFIFHIITLTVFVGLGLYFIATNQTHLAANAFETNIITSSEGLITALFLAFSASLLGVSGFESSANFVEEQKKGVFRKTLRNMLIGVAVFNPIIAYIVLHALPYDQISTAKDFLLADAAYVLGGTIFQYIIVIDAFLVLAGAVLTSYVGVSGLLHRMSSDECFPSLLIKENKKGAYPRIVISFFILCSSILLITGGDLLSLAGVYTIAFLSVMSMFAFGDLILKRTRTELKRTYKAPISIIFFAFIATSAGIIGNIRIDEQNLHFFSLYFIPSMLVVLFVIYQDYFFRFLIKVTHKGSLVRKYVEKHFKDITNGEFIVFIKKPEHIHKVLSYIDRNETGWNVRFVYCVKRNDKASQKKFEEIKTIIPSLQKAGVFPHFSISTTKVVGEFGPDVIHKVSERYGVRENRILVGSIEGKHKFDYEEMGGVRIIL